MMDGYEGAFDDTLKKAEVIGARPESARLVMRRALRRSWRHLAKERIENTKPDIPLGKRFWPVSEKEQNAIETLVASEAMQRLVTLLRSRENDASVDLLDAAYWVKGCSSLGRLSLRRAAQYWPELFQKNGGLFDGHQGSSYCRGTALSGRQYAAR
jgi:uncharacterized protein (DUF2252 family)